MDRQKGQNMDMSGQEGCVVDVNQQVVHQRDSQQRRHMGVKKCRLQGMKNDKQIEGQDTETSWHKNTRSQSFRHNFYPPPTTHTFTEAELLNITMVTSDRKSLPDLLIQGFLQEHTNSPPPPVSQTQAHPSRLHPPSAVQRQRRPHQSLHPGSPPRMSERQHQGACRRWGLRVGTTRSCFKTSLTHAIGCTITLLQGTCGKHM